MAFVTKDACHLPNARWKLYHSRHRIRHPPTAGRRCLRLNHRCLSLNRREDFLRGVTASDRADAVDIPTALIADALNVYRVSIDQNPTPCTNVTADPVLAFTTLQRIPASSHCSIL